MGAVTANRFLTTTNSAFLGTKNDRKAIRLTRTVILGLSLAVNCVLIYFGDYPDPYFTFSGEEGAGTPLRSRLLMVVGLMGLLLSLFFYPRELLYSRQQPRLKIQINDVISLCLIGIGGTLLGIGVVYKLMTGRRLASTIEHNVFLWLLGVVLPFCVTCGHSLLRERFKKRVEKLLEPLTSFAASFLEMVRAFRWKNSVEPYVVNE